jgi:uncharacterized membrane protein
MNRQIARRVSVALWLLVTLSLLAWGFAGYSWALCGIAALPMLAPLNGLIQGRRHTFAWASLFAIPYMAFSITELLANPQARAVGALTLLLVFAWFCALVLFLRVSREHAGGLPGSDESPGP